MNTLTIKTAAVTIEAVGFLPIFLVGLTVFALISIAAENNQPQLLSQNNIAIE